ncbi:hypothetical protein QWY84_19215 [Aquisalimonas lutea]|uniref:hypothetical protein n=1 Tax=Aquisalimonas lutea TaxID=1327750 RepID=UPI0025B3737D|nr:hypothetical protein [Aquisalimonas lutea]MDN3519742.1 hypothetical protein [Aquisalimonas lutea]
MTEEALNGSSSAKRYVQDRAFAMEAVSGYGPRFSTIDDDWIEDAERLAEELDKRINAQREVNGFDLRYNQTLEVDDDAWRDCARVLSQRQVGTLMRQGWG